MEIHHGQLRLAPLQIPVRRGEGIVRSPAQIAPADEVQHPDPHAAQIEDLAAVARRPAGQIRRTQQPGRLIQARGDLGLAEGMVAQRHGVGSGIPDPPGLLLRQPHAGGVFPVDHGKGDVFQFLQRPQVPLQVPQSRLPYHVSHRQHTILHGRFSFQS